MRRIIVRRAAMAATLALTALATARPAEAEVVFDIEQVGADVVATGSGSFDLTGLTFANTSPLKVAVAAEIGYVLVGTPGVPTVDSYQGVTGPTSFGLGSVLTPSSGSGLPFGVQGDGGFLLVPQGYVSGTALSATDTYAGQTFASLGLTPGTFTSTWGTGAHADSLTVQIGPAAVPEPSAMALIGIGAAIDAGARYRRRRLA